MFCVWGLFGWLGFVRFFGGLKFILTRMGQKNQINFNSK